MKMSILTCNIRYFGAKDGDDHRMIRRDFCADVIRAQDADVVCTQETWAEQRADLVAALPEYAMYGLLDEPEGGRPVNTIFYRRDAFELLDASGYWLSETPHVAGSASWASSCIRLANWVMLQPRGSDRRLRILNTHLDHVSQQARQEQARILVEDARGYGDEVAQVLTGDLNCDGTNPAIEVLRAGGWRDSYEAIHGTDDPGHTYHGFQGPAYSGEPRVGKMDWVFVRGKVEVVDASVVATERQGRFPSDHYFVSAQIGLD